MIWLKLGLKEGMTRFMLGLQSVRPGYKLSESCYQRKLSAIGATEGEVYGHGARTARSSIVRRSWNYGVRDGN